MDNWLQLALPNRNGASAGKTPAASEAASGVKLPKFLRLAVSYGPRQPFPRR